MGIYQGSKLMSGGGGGPSPYEIAKQNGYTGTEQAFNQLLAALDQNATEQDLNNKADLVNGKVPAEQVDAYTKTETDTLLQNKANTADFQSHTANKSNPHGVTATQTGAYTKGETDTLLQNKADKDRVVNPNLLDNWYFGNSVDQRQGRVVVPNTTYYSDNTLATSAGTTSAYVTAYRYATGTASGVNYASFKLEDSDTAPTYYAAPENVVRGYTGRGYGIDRWMNENDAVVATLENGLLKLTFSGVSTYMQKVQVPVGIQVTCSVLVDNISGDLYVLWQDIESFTDTHEFKLSQGMNTLTVTTTKQNYRFSIYSNNSNAKTISIKAAKLELGDHQTLAHQDSSGKWVLNEIPDYGEQLALCQRRQYFFNPSGKSVSMIGNGQAYRSDVIIVNFTLPTPMAEDGTPILENLDLSKIQLRGAGQNLTPASVGIDGASHGSSFSLMCAVSGATAGAAYDMILFDYNNLGITNNL